MNKLLKDSFSIAIDNVIKYGDTDVFPFPIENYMLFDEKEKILKLLENIYNNFNNYITNTPPVFEKMLAPSGYTGFRWVTQIDPILNVFLLGLVISISKEIEEHRVKKNNNCIFSYRIDIDNDKATLFDTNFGWHKFQKNSLDLASKYKYVLSCDISNFYQSIYHHRLDNALKSLYVTDGNVIKYIMDIMQNISNTKSYGLPIGGNAARILAELLLDSTDKLLYSKDVKFCRFVDDYNIFAETEQEIYSNLLYLSKILLENEGFSLQKSKTKITTADEFIQSSPINIEETNVTNSIFSISLKYDPYSSTADEDYEKIKKEVRKIDIITLLTKELNKTKIHTDTLKRIIRLLKFSNKDTIDTCIEMLLNNIITLAPIFPNVMIIINNLFDNLSNNIQNMILDTIKRGIDTNEYIFKIDLNLMYTLRLLSKFPSVDNEKILAKIYSQTESKLIKKDIILIMSNWNANYWLSNLKNLYSNLSVWEKRCFILASYTLNDEGRHWREHHKEGFNEIDIVYRDWRASKCNVNGWRLPI